MQVEKIRLLNRLNQRIIFIEKRLSELNRRLEKLEQEVSG